MRRFARLLLGAALIGGFVALLRKLFQNQVSEPAVRDPNGLAELSREELYEQAKRLDIEGRSKMNKAQLQGAIARHGAGGS